MHPAPKSDCDCPTESGLILVVDDQRNMRATTALLLRSEGFVVDECGTGEEAVTLLGGTPIDLMLTDLKMEPMDGLTLLTKALPRLRGRRLQTLRRHTVGNNGPERTV